MQDKPAEKSIKNAPEIKNLPNQSLADQVGYSGVSWVVHRGNLCIIVVSKSTLQKLPLHNCPFVNIE